jgi:non-ribosomal peptide synthetase component F
VVSTAIADVLAEALSTYAHRARATPFSILLCAMEVMIAAATGEDDVAVGTATSGRYPKFARTVGMLANVALVRSRIDFSGTFAAMLEEVSLDLMDAIDHQDLPFSRVVAGLQDDGLEHGVGVVRTMFAAGADGGLTFGEGRVSEVAARTMEGPFELSVTCYGVPGGLALDWEYALRTFSREAAHGYCAAYLEILAALLDQPDAAMDSLGLTEILARVALPAQSEAPPLKTLSATAEPDGPADGSLTPVEAAVAAIWSELLDVPVDTPRADFFRLGGHSMLASRAIAVLREKVSRTASLRLLLDHPELRDFSSRLDVGADRGEGDA